MRWRGAAGTELLDVFDFRGEPWKRMLNRLNRFAERTAQNFRTSFGAAIHDQLSGAHGRV
jgi:hypothetical protein